MFASLISQDGLRDKKTERAGNRKDDIYLRRDHCHGKRLSKYITDCRIYIF